MHEERVTLVPHAVFGKPDPARDYDWRHRLPIPPSVIAYAEVLAKLGVRPVTLYTVAAGEAWVVRCFTGTSDRVSRPVPTVEVLRVISESPLTPEQQLLLLSEVLEMTSDATADAVSVDIPAPLLDSEPLPVHIASAARIGLPLSVRSRTALGVVRMTPWRYDGICYMRAANGLPLPPELARHLGVDAPTARLLAVEEKLLDTAVARASRASEWAILDKLPIAAVHRALHFAASPSSEWPAAAEDPGLARWLVAYYTANGVSPIDSLERLRAIAGDAVLSPELVRMVDPRMTEAAAAALSAIVRHEARDLTRREVNELAASEMLQSLPIGMLPRWSAHAASSAFIANEAVYALTRHGLSRTEATFVLDVSDHADVDYVSPGLRDVIERLQVAPPRARLEQILRNVDSEKRAETFLDVAMLWSGWPTQVADFLVQAAVPADDVDPNFIALALRARSRFQFEPLNVLPLLSRLMAAGRHGYASRILEASVESLATTSPAAIPILRAHIAGGPPAQLQSSENLEELVRFQLMRPADIVPPPDRAELSVVARLWEETEPLAELLQERTAQWVGTPLLPEHWTDTVRAVIDRPLAARLTATAQASERISVRRWLGSLGLFDNVLLDAMWNGSFVSDAQAVRPVLPWITTFASAEPLEWRLALAARIADSGVLREAEGQADQFLETLLPTIDDASRDLLLHALSNVGPFPSLDGVSVAVLSVCCTALDPLEIVDALFRMRHPELSRDPQVLHAVVSRVGNALVSPRRMYTRRQMSRHPELVLGLADLPSWARVADPAERGRIARELAARYGPADDHVGRTAGEGDVDGR